MKFALALVTIIFCSCETNRFDADKRQIITKDEIRQSLRGHSTNFDVVSFTQDTLHGYADTTIKDPIRYTLHFTYTDSTGAAQQKTAYVLFAHNGIAVLTSQIVNQP